ncbi:MAG: DUF6660 family protein [Bacteroidota bacterium]
MTFFKNCLFRNFHYFYPVNISRRIFSFLFVSYLVAIMLMPCNDICNNHQYEAPISVQSASEHHEMDNNICSPFCFCSCCSTAMNILYLPNISLQVQPALQDFVLFDQKFFSIDNSSIWQPPKIS